jgi:small subunit ribosomal protein S17
MKKKLQGIVASNKMDKSLRVEIQRRYRHPMYGKIVRGRTICYVHDEENQAEEGDVVEIVECRPRSKTKRWELVRIVESARARMGLAEVPAGPGEETTAEEETVTS